MSSESSSAAGSRPAETPAAAQRPVMVVAIDDGEHSFYALRWTLQHFFPNAHLAPPLFSLVLVHSKPSPASVIGFAGPGGTADILPLVESDLRKIASRVVDKAKAICVAASVKDVAIHVVDGDARNTLCDAVDKHHASMLVLGSHGYGKIKRAVLGSVSDYCVHHAHCTVMIVKKPKTKN